MYNYRKHGTNEPTVTSHKCEMKLSVSVSVAEDAVLLLLKMLLD